MAFDQYLKPIFHSPNAKDSTFALPNAKNTNMLVSIALDDANVLRYLTQHPQCESVEYRLPWVPNAKSSRWPCTFHVVCVNFICVWCPTQTQFSVEYGLNMSDIFCVMGTCSRENQSHHTVGTLIFDRFKIFSTIYITFNL